MLAWGNSLMDLINNTSMAGKSAGGNSMAMTACYAGPLFNMLIGGCSLLVWQPGPWAAPQLSSCLIAVYFRSSCLLTVPGWLLLCRAGLGLGFWSLLSDTGERAVGVVLPLNAGLGFGAIMVVSCFW